MGGQNLFVDAGAEIKTFQKCLRREFQEVLKTGAVLGQDGDVIAGVLRAAGVFLVEAAGRGDIGLDAHDRVDAHILGRFVELQGPVQIAVVGQGQGVHAQLFGPLQQAGDFSGAVEKAVVAMAVQMGKRRGAHRNLRVTEPNKEPYEIVKLRKELG